MASQEEINAYHDLIYELAKEAGEFVKEGFYGGKNVEKKGGKSWDLVTNYDTRVEELLIEGILKKYPDHQFVAEELTAKTKQIPGLTDAPTWIIDPIDGTTNFVHGLPFTCISVALAINKEVLLGLIYNPIHNDMFTAIKGQGAFCNGAPIKVSQVTELENAVVCTEPSIARVPIVRERTIRRLTAITLNVQGVRSLGCAAATLGYVANGGMDAFYVDGLQSWDIAAGVLITEEAGGYACNTDGGELDLFGRSVLVTSTKALAEKIVAVMKAADEEAKSKK